MITNQNNINDTDEQKLDEQIEALTNEAKQINQEIAEDKKESEIQMDEIEKEINESVGNLEKIYSDLDATDKEAEEKLDKIILEDAEDLATDEEGNES